MKLKNNKSAIRNPQSAIQVPVPGRPYDVRIGEEILEGIAAALDERAPGAAVFVVSNPKIFSLYGSKVLSALKKSGRRAVPLRVPDGERYKTLRSAARLYDALIGHRAERSAVVLALGGGVIGDLAGFVAATYLRGVRLVQVPTTLLAQVDSAVGGKVGVNHPRGKNLIGAFHHPEFVWADVATLRTLPEREYRQGLYEVIKYGVVADADLFERLEREMPALRARHGRALLPVIRRCCEIKAAVVAEDERESHRRMILNFGHTVGHALEAVTSYRVFKHGEAVGWGMIAAARLAERMGLLAPAARDRIERLVDAGGARPPVRGLTATTIMAAMRRDKKVKAGALRFVLPHQIGAVTVRSDVPERLAREVLRGLAG